MLLGPLCALFNTKQDSYCSHFTAKVMEVQRGKVDVGKTLGFEDDGQERILETSLMQKGDFIKAQGQDPWAERAALGL